MASCVPLASCCTPMPYRLDLLPLNFLGCLRRTSGHSGVAAAARGHRAAARLCRVPSVRGHDAACRQRGLQRGGRPGHLGVGARGYGRRTERASRRTRAHERARHCVWVRGDVVWSSCGGAVVRSVKPWQNLSARCLSLPTLVMCRGKRCALCPFLEIWFWMTTRAQIAGVSPFSPFWLRK